ncbi:MAG: transposase [Desulfovibrionaceae bacterium]|nr:transposase [Desulfovibrionaceae bacterium]MBF0515156.1 transposase [Desulfovibrionaceae bacterium]
MERRYSLADDQWDKIKDVLPGGIDDRGRTALDSRLFIDAMMWMAKIGSPWSDLPEEYGKGHVRQGGVNFSDLKMEIGHAA